MNIIIRSILVLLFVGLLNTTAGLKWVPMTIGGKIPPNAVVIDEKVGSYVGRSKGSSRQFVPTEVYKAGDATIKEHGEDLYVSKIRYEVLTTSELDKCEWKSYYYSNHYEDIDENIVRAGIDTYGNDLESLFVGRSYVNEGSKHITSIILPKTQETKRWMGVDPEDHPYEQWQYLSCDPSTVWMNVSTLSINLQPGSVSAGVDSEGSEIFVARSKLSNGNFLTGYVIPSKNAAVFEDPLTIEPRGGGDSDSEDYYSPPASDNHLTGEYQVLIGETKEYDWVAVKDGLIPDNAVVNGKRKLELVHVARIDNTVRPLTPIEAFEKKSGFDILIKNEI